MTSLLIIEDEPPAIRRLEELIHLYTEDIEICLATDLPTAQSLLGQRNFDIITLDLNLDGEDGFRVLDDLSKAANVIVVSAHGERAIEAFDHGVVDFVPKPVSQTRLHLALSRAASRVQRPRTHIPLRSANGIEIVDPSQICAIVAVDNYSEVHMLDGRTFVDDRSLANFETLTGDAFLRIHRAALVNTIAIKSVEKSGNSWATHLTNNKSYPISRRKLRAVKDIIA